LAPSEILEIDDMAHGGSTGSSMNISTWLAPTAADHRWGTQRGAQKATCAQCV